MCQISTFRYLKLIDKILNIRLPSYLNDILHFRVYKIDVQNSSTRLSLKKKYKISRYGNSISCIRSFSVDAVELWDALYVPLRTIVNYSYLKSNILLLIRNNLFYYFK